MAAPIIRSVVATPSSLLPGQSATVVIDAYDPDARSVRISGSVVDVHGSRAEAVTVLTVGDPLTYELTCDDPSAQISQDPQDPSRFAVQV